MSSEGIHAVPSAAAPGYSAHVRIELLINGQRLPVAQVGGGRLIFDDPVSLTASTGEVIMSIDGQESRWQVALRPTLKPSRIIEAHFEPE